jgi:chemotaxis protein histidine kinase CheA
VIKSLDDSYTAGGPFSGATIREDGDVSLILDVIRLLRDARAPLNAAA